MNCGRRWETIFHGEKYYRCFIDTLSETVEKFGLVVHAYCLMSNHDHLLVSTPHGHLQRAMRHIGGVYTQRYYRLKGVDGSLFKGRDKAIRVDRDEYLLHVSQYIDLDPLEAKRVTSLKTYVWSSDPYVGACKAAKWLTTDEVYGQLTSSRQRAARYHRYVEDVESDEAVQGFYRKLTTPPVLGSQKFVTRIIEDTCWVESNQEKPRKDSIRTMPSLGEIVSEVAAHYAVPTEE